VAHKEATRTSENPLITKFALPRSGEPCRRRGAWHLVGIIRFLCTAFVRGSYMYLRKHRSVADRGGEAIGKAGPPFLGGGKVASPA
jgi:hypothetical protein